jgi:uncharacterized membrane protein YkgB
MNTAARSLDGRAALRLGIVLIFLVFGYMKFLPYEAEGVAGIARDYWRRRSPGTSSLRQRPR